MRKRTGICLTICVALMSILTVLPNRASGLDLMDGDLHVSGKLDNFTGIRTESRAWYDSGIKDAETESGDLSRCRSTLQLEAEWRLTPDLTLHAIGRGYYEAKYSIDDDIYTSKEDADDLNAIPRGDGMQSDADLREFYIKYTVGNFLISVGKQQIVWGESDALRMSDIINPLDMSWHYVFADWEDIRIPLRLIDVKYRVPNSKYKLTAELVWNPEDFKPNSFAPYGDNYYIFGDVPTLTFMLPPGVTFRGIFFDAMKEANNRDEGNHSLRNGAGGVRLGGMFGGWEVFLYDYYQPAQSPVATLDQSIMMTDPHMGLRFEYPYINTLGATFNVFNNFTGTVFRGECGYIFNEPFTKNVPLPIPGMVGPDSNIVKKDSFSYMLGFDRPTMIPFLNQTRSFFISGQIFQKFVFNSAGVDGLATGVGEDGDDDHNFITTLLIDTNYWDDKLKPAVLVAWDIRGKNGFFRPKISYQPTFDWDITLGYLRAWGDNYNSGTFGPVKDTDEVFLKLTYKL